MNARLTSTAADFLEPARVQPCYDGMDDVADFAQTYRPARPADPDDVFSQDEDAAEALRLRAELTRRAQPTLNGKYIGVAMDACAALHQIITTIRGQDNFDQFSEVDVNKWAAICRRVGYRDVNGSAQ
jgi:hypothetical protein